MRGDKTFARILLIFSIAHVVIAAPAVVRQRSFVPDVPDGSTDESAPLLETAPDVSETSPPPSQAASLHEPSAGSEHDPAPGSPAGSSHQGGVPAAPPPSQASEHQDWTPSHGSLSDVPLSQDLTSSHDADFAPLLGTTESHYVSLSDSPPTSQVQPSKWRFVPLGDTPTSGSGAQSFNKDPLWWENTAHVSEIEQASSSSLPPSHLGPGAPGAAPLHKDLPSAWGPRPLFEYSPWWSSSGFGAEKGQASPSSLSPSHSGQVTPGTPEYESSSPEWYQNSAHGSGIDQASVSSMSLSHWEPGALGAPGATTLHNDLPSELGPQPLVKAPPWWPNYGPGSERGQAGPSSLSSLHSGPVTPGSSGSESLSSQYYENFAPGSDIEPASPSSMEVSHWGTVSVETEVKEVADEVKLPKGLCGLRCWRRFHPRSSKSSPERDHGHRYSWG